MWVIRLRRPGAVAAAAVGLGLLLSASPARAASLVCTSLSDFSWPAIDDVGSTDWDCADADSPGADDDFVIAHEVTVSGDLVQDGVTPGTGIEVASGGSLLAQDPVEIVVNDAGLDCRAGSTCRLEGGYRQFGDPAPALLPDPDPLASFRVGDVILCPDAGGQSDCATPGLRSRVRFSYPSATYGPGAPQELPHICTSIAAIDDGGGPQHGDVIAFWNPDPLDLNEGPDTNFWYEIVEVSGTDPCFIDFNVHQGTLDQDGYPLTRREIAAYSPSVSAQVGGRVLELPASSVPADDHHNGRMLRFEAGGAAEAEGYRIYDTVSGATAECDDAVGPCDLLKIADHRGFATAKNIASPDEDEVWIDYGWEPGDPFLVIAPVRIQAATPARSSAPVYLRGTVSAEGVVFDNTDTLTWDAQVTEGCEDLWLEDLYTGSGDKLHLFDGMNCERVCITGGDPDAGFDISHTIVSATSNAITIEAAGLRHGGDDFFSVLNGFTPNVTFHRYRGQFKSTNAPSDECIATGGDPVPMTVSDVECLDASNSGSVLGPATAAPFDGNSIIAIANRGPLWGSAFGVPDPHLTDVTIIGADYANSNHEILPVNTDRFVVRDSRNSNGRLLNGADGYVRNGIALDNVIDNPLGLVVGDIEVSNVAIIRTTRPSGAAPDLVSSTSTPSSAEWRNVLFLQEAGTPIFQRLWRLRSSLTDLSGFAWEGIAFVNHIGAPASQALLNQSGIALDHPTQGIQFDGPLCFYNNQSDADPTSLGQLPAGTLHGVNPQFVDASADLYQTEPDSPWDLAGCGVLRGADAPGIPEFQRYHAWSNLVPQVMATACDDGVDRDGDGFADFPDDPGCTSYADDSEREPLLPCDNGVDDDMDGDSDFPADIGCSSPNWTTEEPQCDDGIDNDMDGFVDWDGGGVGMADPQCNAPHKLKEKPVGCGLGWEAVPLLGLWATLRRRRRVAATAARPGAATRAPC